MRVDASYEEEEEEATTSSRNEPPQTALFVLVLQNPFRLNDFDRGFRIIVLQHLSFQAL